jgi:hypothetical protein
LLLKQCGIAIGITWLVVSNGLFAITCGTSTNVLVVFKGSGGITRKVFNTHKFETMGIKYWLAEKRGDDSVFSATVDLWVTTLMSMVTVRLVGN